MGGKQGKENPLDSANEINVLLLVWLAKDAFLHQRRPLKKSEECFVMDRTQKKFLCDGFSICCYYYCFFCSSRYVTANENFYKKLFSWPFPFVFFPKPSYLLEQGIQRNDAESFNNLGVEDVFLREVYFLLFIATAFSMLLAPLHFYWGYIPFDKVFFTHLFTAPETSLV